jgi:hypothetical protein
MDASSLSAVREALTGSPLLAATRSFAGSLRGAVTRRTARGLLLVGTAQYEPWHLAAHLDDEATWSAVPQLSPLLIRRQAGPPRGPGREPRPGLERLAAAGRGETVLVVSPGAAEPGLLERVRDARRGGAVVLALETGDPELGELAHERLTVDEPAEPGFDLVQHLVSAAAGEQPRSRLGRLVRQFTTEPVNRW